LIEAIKEYFDRDVILEAQHCTPTITQFCQQKIITNNE